LAERKTEKGLTELKLKILAVYTTCAAVAVLAACSSDSAGSTAQDNATSSQSRVTMDSEALEPVQTEPLSTEKHGYGQGVLLDDSNRPTGALDFNSQYGEYNARAINDSDGKILLTFDQGYENGYTGQILDTLKEKNVKAVFFLLEDYAEKNPELVQRMIDEGHTLGNHSVHHYSMPDLSPEECADEINGMQSFIKEKFGYEMTLFRPPMGEFSEQSLSVTEQCGCETVLWSYAYADWDTENQPDPAESKQKLINAAHGGAIYLLHSVSQTNAEILGDVIDGIRANGFEFEDGNTI
jgi:peptidoglycan-N-acetylmuramic acid deacetylase